MKRFQNKKEESTIYSIPCQKTNIRKEKHTFGTLATRARAKELLFY